MLARQIGENIKRARKTQGISLERLAARVEPATSYQQLSRLEKGDRALTVDWIERIARALGVPPQELILPDAERDFSLGEQVANEIAQTLAAVVLGGEAPDDDIVQVVALMLQELSATFARHPEAFRDATVARPVIDLAGMRYVPAKKRQ
jgi:transcriptional regulator with XRE-family HTH domain